MYLKKILYLICLVALLAAGNSYAATDMFLKIEGIEGESVDDVHSGEIDVLAWSWSTNHGTTSTGPGGGAGKVNVQDISFTKFLDKSTPDLLLKCAKGEHIEKATLTVRQSGERPLEYLTLELQDVIITSVSTGGSGGEDRLTENITLNFTQVRMIYTEQNPDGSPGQITETRFDYAPRKK